jgi:hypothetical protein
MSDLLRIATRKGLFIGRRLRSGWQLEAPPDFLGQPVSNLLRDPRDGALYAALNLGHFGVKLHRSDDGGTTWAELPAPAFAKSEAKDAPSVQLIWTLVPGGAEEPGVLWAGTIPGALFRSADRGQTWQLNEALWTVPGREKWFGGGYDKPGIHSILLDPCDSRAMTVGVSCGGLWKSADGGASWSVGGRGLFAAYMPPEMAEQPEIQDPHRLAHCGARPERLWCQHHNGMFISDDAGRTFRSIEPPKPSAFGFAVAAHPEKPDTAWFVPAVKDECRVPADGHLVVLRSDDGGASFTAFDRGLPSSRSYDLIYRHAFDVDRAGRRLAMGSTTGNLWLSEDGGEAWTPLSAHLPPIAALAFD